MKNCSNCEISIENPLYHCPLCYTTLTKKDDFPEVDSYPAPSLVPQVYSLLIKILAFISFTVIVVCVTINYLTPIRFPWSFIVALSIAYVWISLSTAFRRGKKVAFNLMIQLITLGLLCLIVGYLLGINYYMYNYVLCALTVSAMLSFNILALVERKNVQNFLIYYLIVNLTGFIPIILYAFGKLTVLWTPIISAAYSVISIVSLFIFAPRSAKSELKKRLHF